MKRTVIICLLGGAIIGWILHELIAPKHIQEGDTHNYYIDIKKPKAGRNGILNLNASLGIEEGSDKPKPKNRKQKKEEKKRNNEN